MSGEQTTEHVCQACKSDVPERGYTFPLCRRCREGLIKRPFPQWIKIVIFIIIVLMSYSSFRLPIAFNAGLANQTAKKAEAEADYSTAISKYQSILRHFPYSEEHKARLAVCYLKSGEVRQAVDILRKLDDKKLSDKVVNELNALIDEIKQKKVN